MTWSLGELTTCDIVMHMEMSGGSICKSLHTNEEYNEHEYFKGSTKGEDREGRPVGRWQCPVPKRAFGVGPTLYLNGINGNWAVTGCWSDSYHCTGIPELLCPAIIELVQQLDVDGYCRNISQVIYNIHVIVMTFWYILRNRLNFFWTF